MSSANIIMRIEKPKRPNKDSLERLFLLFWEVNVSWAVQVGVAFLSRHCWLACPVWLEGMLRNILSFKYFYVWTVDSLETERIYTK